MFSYTNVYIFYCFKQFWTENQTFRNYFLLSKKIKTADSAIRQIWIFLTEIIHFSKVTLSIPDLCILCYYCRLLAYFKNNFSKNYFRNTIRLSNGLDRVGPDLGP